MANFVFVFVNVVYQAPGEKDHEFSRFCPLAATKKKLASTIYCRLYSVDRI